MTYLFSRKSSALIGALCFLGGCMPDLVLETKYENHSEIVSSDAMQKGWIPLWLPAQAREIHEKHDLDTSASALFFTLSSQEWPISGVDCRSVNHAPKPRVKLGFFPKNIHEKKNLFICDDFFVYNSENNYFLWRNNGGR